LAVGASDHSMATMGCKERRHFPEQKASSAGCDYSCL
jgi:hypothetical protein